MNIIEKAMLLALKAHDGQMRKEAPISYIVHPVSVALILSQHGFAPEVVAAGLVHDVVEDTPVTLDEVRQQLGDRVADIVAPITHDHTQAWEDKKRAYIESVRIASPEVKAVSVADKIANAHSLIDAHAEQGVAVWKYFNAGRDKKLWFENAMFAMLEETWEHELVGTYRECVRQMNALE